MPSLPSLPQSMLDVHTQTFEICWFEWIPAWIPHFGYHWIKNAKGGKAVPWTVRKSLVRKLVRTEMDVSTLRTMCLDSLTRSLQLPGRCQPPIGQRLPCNPNPAAFKLPFNGRGRPLRLCGLVRKDLSREILRP